MSRLELLQSMCVGYSFDDIDAFSDLLHAGATVFPGIDREIAKIYDVNLDTVRLWMDGSIIPDRRTQSDIVIFVHNKAKDYREAESIHLSPITSMTR